MSALALVQTGALYQTLRRARCGSTPGAATRASWDTTSLQARAETLTAIPPPGSRDPSSSSTTRQRAASLTNRAVPPMPGQLPRHVC